jgi:AcrR family transcriptional regulator
VTPRERLLAAAVEYFAEHGIGDHSLRALATELGTSHRMLIYHFGSREGLLAEVVRVVEDQQRAALSALRPDGDVLDQSLRFWTQVADEALRYGRLFFELSAHAMQGRPHTEALRGDLIGRWLPPLTDLFVRAGVPASAAPAYARLGLAAARGLLFDLLITGDRVGVDEAAHLLNRLLMPDAAGPGGGHKRAGATWPPHCQ